MKEERRMYWISFPGIIGLVFAWISGAELATESYKEASLFLALAFLSAALAYRKVQFFDEK